MTGALLAAASALTLVSLLLSMVRIALQLLSPLALRRLAERDGRGAEHFARYQERPLRTQVLLQIANQAAMVTGGVLIAAYVHARGLPWPLAISLAAPWTLLLLFNHILPRFVAHQSPERVAQVLLPPMMTVSSVLGPIGSLVAWMVVGRGSEVSNEKDDEERREELTALLDAGTSAGIIGKEDATLVESVVDFGDTILREVMTPRVDMVCVRADTALGDLADTFVREGFARMPVFHERLDNIEGFVHVKDVLSALRAGRDRATARDLLKPISFDPETKRVAQTLRELQAAKRQMAICIDEYGSVSGLVSIEDLLEEIVGEIHDEYDEVAADIVRDERGVLILAGKTPILALSRELGIEIAGEGEFETVSGLILSLIGRIPQKGEHVDYEGWRFEVVEADRRRITRLKASRLAPPPEAETAATPSPGAAPEA